MRAVSIRFRTTLFAGCLMLLCITAPAAAQTDGASRIAFVTQNRETRTTTISTVAADGSDMAVLINAETGSAWNPVWSPDGRSLAFIGVLPNHGRRNLYVIDSDGTHLRAITSARAPAEPGSVAWSPDSSQLLFGATIFGGRVSGFYRINLDGSGQELLQFDAIDSLFMEMWVAWSPDGSQVAVHAMSDDSYGQLYTADADGSHAAPFLVTDADGHSFFHLTWSPDGQRVVLNTPPSLFSMEPQPMAMANADGSEASVFLPPPPNLSASPSWSPDGRQIALVANEPGVETMPNQRLWIANADGSAAHSLDLGVNVASLGTSWGQIPADIVLPAAPVLLTTAAQP